MSQPPDQIGPYTIAREIGRGGMGVVYLARDTKLDRDVAIKALPPELAEDEERLVRFEREAKTLATLNHPHIASIYGLEEVEGQRYLILEYIPGDTLSETLDHGPIPVSEALPIAKQIAEAVEAAHESGIIHRDLKPANIKFTSGGQDSVKVLDFGLAKAFENQSSSAGEIATSPTYIPTNTPTITGVVLGTAGYLSPEQARGRMVDKRSDIFSFGCVLYEMLAGKTIFAGETVADSLGATLHREPVWDDLPDDTPPTILLLLRRCLTKDRKRRLHDIADARVEIEDAISDPTSSSLNLAKAALAASGAPSAQQSRWRIAAGVVIGILLTAAAGWLMTLAEAPPSVRKFDLMTASEAEPLDHVRPRISPDGTRLAYVKDGVVQVRDFSSFESRALTNTEDAINVFWSPDSEWIGYLTGRAIYKVALREGGVMKLAELEDSLNSENGGGWTTDNRIVFSQGLELLTIPARGGQPSVLLKEDKKRLIDFHDVGVMVGTNILLYIEHRIAMNMVIVASNGDRRVDVVEGEELIPSQSVYSPTGHILYTQGYREQSLWAIGFDVKRMEVTGEPFLVLPDASQPSVSQDGTLVVQRGGATSTGEMVWVTSAGELTPLGIEVSELSNPVISPQEDRIAYASGERGNNDIWVHDLVRGSSSRVTFIEGFVTTVGWSPNGQELGIIHFDPTGDVLIRTRFFAADGSGESRAAIDLASSGVNADWSRMTGMKPGPNMDMTMFEVALDDPSSMIEVFTTDMEISAPVVSPDWSLMAFAPRGSGQSEIFCTRYPQGAGRWQVSTDGGMKPKWSVDGKTLYYESNDGDSIFGVEVTYEPSVQFGMPQKVMDAKALGLNLQSGWTLTPDGERFLASRKNEEESQPTTISVITNWYEEFRER
jgi:serine/threonine protein kinase